MSNKIRASKIYRKLTSHWYHKKTSLLVLTSFLESSWIGSVPEISVFPTGISVSGLKILPYEHFSPVTGMKAGWILAAWMALSCIAYCVFHIIRIPFNCIDTALRVVKAMVGPKVRTFVFIRIWFIYRISSQKLVPRILGLFSSRKPG